MLNPREIAAKLEIWKPASLRGALSIAEMLQALCSVFGNGAYVSFDCTATKYSTQKEIVLVPSYRVSCIAPESGSKCHAGAGGSWQEAWDNLVLSYVHDSDNKTIEPKEFEQTVEVLIGQRIFPLVEP